MESVLTSRTIEAVLFVAEKSMPLEMLLVLMIITSFVFKYIITAIKRNVRSWKHQFSSAFARAWNLPLYHNIEYTLVLL